MWPMTVVKPGIARFDAVKASVKGCRLNAYLGDQVASEVGLKIRRIRGARLREQMGVQNAGDGRLTAHVVRMLEVKKREGLWISGSSVVFGRIPAIRGWNWSETDSTEEPPRCDSILHETRDKLAMKIDEEACLRQGQYVIGAWGKALDDCVVVNIRQGQTRWIWAYR